MKDAIETVGHNSGVDISEDKFHAYLAASIDLDAEISVLKAKRKKMRKKMRADGIRLTEFDAAAKFSEMTRDDVQDHFVHLKQYMTWRRHPIGTQLSLNLDNLIDGDFEDDDVIMARARENAISEGFLAGLSNRDMGDNPHVVGSEIGQVWIEAWHDGQKRRAQEIIDPLDDTDD